MLSEGSRTKCARRDRKVPRESLCSSHFMDAPEKSSLAAPGPPAHSAHRLIARSKGSALTTNSSMMSKKTELIPISPLEIKSRMLVVRGQPVLLDRDMVAPGRQSSFLVPVTNSRRSSATTFRPNRPRRQSS